MENRSCACHESGGDCWVYSTERLPSCFPFTKAATDENKRSVRPGTVFTKSVASSQRALDPLVGSTVSMQEKVEVSSSNQIRRERGAGGPEALSLNCSVCMFIGEGVGDALEVWPMGGCV